MEKRSSRYKGKYQNSWEWLEVSVHGFIFLLKVFLSASLWILMVKDQYEMVRIGMNRFPSRVKFVEVENKQHLNNYY